MRKPNKEERAKRRAKLVQAGEARLDMLRDGSATAEQVTEMREAVLRGDCPLCGESGFKSIAGHCQAMHGVLSRDLRDLLGLTYTESICSPTLSATLREHGIGKNPSLLGKPGAKTFSKKGRAAITASAANWSKNVPSDTKADAGRKGGSQNKGQRRSSVEHGTMREYKKGCKCDLCMQAQRDHWKRWRDARRQPSNAKSTPKTSNIPAPVQ
jgi:hypothetical protein